MFSYIWHTFFFDPVYNGLVFFVDVIPGGDVGLAIVLTTIVVKLILLPLSIKATKTQLVMREIEPKLKELKESIKDRQEQALAMMSLYRQSGINPFASIFLLFIQIPILIALFFSVNNGGGTALPDINLDILYSFVPPPDFVNMIFLGWQDIAARSLPLAILAGVAQYTHSAMTIPKPAPRDPKAKPDLKADLTHSMQLQMRYVMPFIIAIFAYTTSAAIALYFAVSALFAVGQECLVRYYRRPASNR